MNTRVILAAGAVIALAAAAPPVVAQKSADTLRIAFSDPVSSVDIQYDAKPETAFTSRSVFDTLIAFNGITGEFEPLLAKSWRRIDERTLEFELRDDVTFHDGTPMTVDDVVYSFNWFVHPDTNLRFKQNFDWMERAEKIDQHTLRVIAKEPTAVDLSRLALNFQVFPGELHSRTEPKSDYGVKTPIGTGPYKVEFIDANRGVMLVRNENYVHATPAKPAGRVGRIHAVPIPDLQTQIAELMTGGIDMITNVPKDQAENLAGAPNLQVTAIQGLVYTYFSVDASDRTGTGLFKDPRVREAVFSGVDRAAIARHVVAGGEEVRLMDAKCFKVQVGCDYSTKPVAYDPERARRLLAEAGHPDGFDLEITTFTGAEDVAAAVAGELRRIGIRATVDRRTIPAYRKKQAENQQVALVGHWSSGGLPDAAATMGVFFTGRVQDFTRDPRVTELAAKAEIELDVEKRRALYREAYDLVNQNSYILPLATKPAVFVHTDEVVVERGSLDPLGVAPSFIRWR